jgi:hypothetical protein
MPKSRTPLLWPALSSLHALICPQAPISVRLAVFMHRAALYRIGGDIWYSPFPSRRQYCMGLCTWLACALGLELQVRGGRRDELSTTWRSTSYGQVLGHTRTRQQALSSMWQGLLHGVTTPLHLARPSPSPHLCTSRSRNSSTRARAGGGSYRRFSVVH